MVSRRVLSAAAVLTIAILAGAGPAAAAITLTPVQVELTPARQSDLISVTNDSDDPLRLQVEVFAWQQRPDGETVLEPTKDILAFPPLLTMAAHETKRIRVGATVPPGAAEKPYRMSVQELPEPTAQGGPASVRMLTKISIPVFLQPGPVTISGRIEAVPSRDGAWTLRVENTGTRRFVLAEIDARGIDGAGATLFDAKAAGWYVLAGGQRDYSLALSAADCRAAHSLELSAKLDDRQLKTTVPVQAGTCGAGAKTQIGNPAP
ncbi:MAG TPA: fimbria/pilus periplasmic chaperone [Stellaceae bacterium]|nr:fimbria/pilus periplasmic chaperone [Stellaceae bacterium]